MADGKTEDGNPVAAYKTQLRDMIDRRPSGTRQKIAHALGKHKSFVSQITNPAYAVPVPARHLPTIFEICHFSPEERRSFVEAYQRAHPGRHVRPADGQAHAPQTIVIEVPAFNDRRRQAELIDAIKLFSRHAIELAKKWDGHGTGQEKGRRRK